MARYAWILFSLFILYGVLIPFDLYVNTETILFNIRNISWIPFIDPDGTRASIPDIVQNILLFLPFGFFGFLALSSTYPVRIVLVTVIGALFSTTIEILQLLTIDRTTSVTDLVTNTTGTFFGTLAASAALLISSEIIASKTFRKYRENPFIFPLLVACALVVFGTLQPFDFTLDVGSVWSKVKYFTQAPFDFDPILRDEGVVFVRFVLLAFVGALFFQENDYTLSIPKGMMMSAIIGIFFEGSQCIVASRMPTIQDVVVVLIGSLCGGLLAVMRNTWHIPRIVWGILIIEATSVSVGMQLLHPFRLAGEYRSMNWLPFLPYYERTTFVALSNFIESVLMYFPMGFLLQCLFSRRKSRFLLLGALTLIIAFPLELAQGWIVNRYPDITDVLGALTGGLAGCWCCSDGWETFDRYLRRIP
jgi:glycopeptide antibiotics resistance protein